MKYMRLAGNRKYLFNLYTLWLGDDHLLVVDSTGFSERYTRYYLKDIQAVTSYRTGRRMVWNIILSFSAVFVLIPLIAAWTTSITFTAGVLACLVLGLLLYNNLRGPTCKCHIRMPLGIYELDPVRRAKTIEKVLTRIRPLIEQFQGSMPDRNIREPLSDKQDETVANNRLSSDPDVIAQRVSNISSRDNDS